MAPDHLQFGYSTNVHPGDDLPQVRRSLEEFAVPIARRVFGGRPAGLELRLGIGAARGLLGAGAREEFREFLGGAGLRLFSVNAYPLREFHAPRVKEGAYRPPWTTAERTRWTRRIARILADLLEPGLVGSLSTLGGTYRPFGHGPAVLDRIARGYLETVRELAAIEEETGKRIVLAVEPEPDTSFETAGDIIRFFEDHLLPAAFAGNRRGERRRIEEVLRRHWTVNLDTCHLSVVFRRPAAEMELLRRAGIGIGKIHVTSALALRDPARSPRAYGDLRGIAEPRYLHQVRGADRRGRIRISTADLDGLPESAAGLPREVAELRSHFHIPVCAARWGRLGTTQEETREAVLLALRRDLCRHLVIETYTWPLLGKSPDLVAGIAREFRWLMGVVGG